MRLVMTWAAAGASVPLGTDAKFGVKKQPATAIAGRCWVRKK